MDPSQALKPWQESRPSGQLADRPEPVAAPRFTSVRGCYGFGMNADQGWSGVLATWSPASGDAFDGGVDLGDWCFVVEASLGGLAGGTLGKRAWKLPSQGPRAAVQGPWDFDLFKSGAPGAGRLRRASAVATG